MKLSQSRVRILSLGLLTSSSVPFLSDHSFRICDFKMTIFTDRGILALCHLNRKGNFYTSSLSWDLSNLKAAIHIFTCIKELDTYLSTLPGYGVLCNNAGIGTFLQKSSVSTNPDLFPSRPFFVILPFPATPWFSFWLPVHCALQSHAWLFLLSEVLSSSSVKLTLYFSFWPCVIFSFWRIWPERKKHVWLLYEIIKLKVSFSIPKNNLLYYLFRYK